ncbi:LysM peptidoglycan-binding domain-containing protein [Anaeromicropila populeti]|uniref:Spore germination protein n=1 Tax=Anaeromicropila populeti TaxID=37658 RepID=A0A1I6LKN1_9FIRM|nr:LysM peptidoglycan-binding domain-containing protein [Anaeromicropila populeti]SFS04044.1 spore germination protein [Anaeromicropila populeti]
MDIYVVQPGDTINSIADKYGVSIERLISDNGLINPYTLVVGQTIVILYPKITYIVKQDDTLESIADKNGISIVQLMRNNPYLYVREFIYPGDVLVISYNTVKDLQVIGYAYTFINHDTLKRTLPYLTYLSIFNYRVAENADIVDYGDDTELIQIAKSYNTVPLLMISAFSPTGDLDLENVYDLLLNDEKQDKLVNEMLEIVRSKGFYGINTLLSNISESNQKLYLNVLTKLSMSLRKEGYIFMVTMPPNLTKSGNNVIFENIDYKSLSLIVDRIIFLQNVWGKNKQPPSPISNISLIRPFIEYVTNTISSEILSIGKPLIGYDWELPFSPSSSYANSMSLESAITLAYVQGAVIHTDEESQTPYFTYSKSEQVAPENHIVWFINAFSIKALEDVIIEYNLIGSGIWNISIFYQQIWSILNAVFNILKFPII